jgi:hypothetical protein
MNDLQSVLHFLWQIFHTGIRQQMPKIDIERGSLLFSVLGGKKHSLDSGSQSSDEFLLDSSDGSNATPKGNFALYCFNIVQQSPRSFTLTVMAIVGGTAFPENSEISAIVCAMPADGPSYACQ